MPNSPKRTATASESSVENLKTSLKEYHSILNHLKSVQKIKKAPLSVKKSETARLGREEKRVYLRDKMRQACEIDAFTDIDKLIGLTHQSYLQYKALPGAEYNTHQFITDKAIGLLNLSADVAKTLHQYCTYPDESKSDMCDLIFEGHFYGPTRDGASGNFLVDMFPDGVLAAMEALKKMKFGIDEDIHENALTNFKRYCEMARNNHQEDRNFYLGVAAHFLQDLTAPHHTGNYPAVPYVDHYFFEKYAGRYVYHEPAFKISKAAYRHFKTRLKSNPGDPGTYALEITGKAKPFIPYIESDFSDVISDDIINPEAMNSEINRLNRIAQTGKHEKWEQAIVGAVPLAIYATAYLFENDIPFTERSPKLTAIYRQ